MSHDLIVIGAGPAGYVAAERAGAHGKKVLLVEREEHLGGVCLNWGCVPTKALLACAKTYYNASHGAAYGVSADNVRFDLAVAMARKQKVQDGLRQGIRGLMKKFKVEVVQGTAKLVAKDTVEVGGARHQAKAILVCTGSRPAKPPIPGLDLPHVKDSSAILGLTALPKRLVVIGGGVIGVEFACFFASVGVAVEVVELMPEITPGIDTECAKILREELAAKGVKFHLGHKVTKVTAEAVHHVDAAGVETATASDTVLVCIGRTPNTDGLGLETVGVDVKNRLVQVDERCRTNVPGIWAAGDCASRIMLAHVGSRMAEVAVRDMCGESDRMRWNAIPGVIYTSPEVAGAGLTEEAAKAQGIPVRVAKWNLAANGRFLAEFSGKGLVKAVLHEKTGVLLGVHGVGGGVSEQVAAWSAMIEAEFRLRELTELVFPHPTVSEALRDAAWTMAH